MAYLLKLKSLHYLFGGTHVKCTDRNRGEEKVFKRQSELVIYDERERGKEEGVSKQIFKYFGGLKVGKFRGQKPPFFNTTS